MHFSESKDWRSSGSDSALQGAQASFLVGELTFHVKKRKK